MDSIYTAVATASGGGRDGHVTSDDDRIDFDTRPPKEMGGSGEGTNPEQLFAAGYSACFLGALHASGRELGIDTTDASVSASVGIGAIEGGFGLEVELVIYAPKAGADREKVSERAHEMCPYSNATRGNIEVTLSYVD